MDYSFNVDVAKIYGVDEAIFIHSLEFWIRKNRANERHFHDGRWWTYNTLAALERLFPFWTKRQLERIVSSCRTQGAVITGNYSDANLDRTTWYALCDDTLSLYGHDIPISPNGEMHFPEPCLPFHETGKCYIDTVTGLTVNPPISPTENPVKPKRVAKAVPRWKPERFEGFWKLYPRGEDRQGAVEAWDKLKPDDELLANMGTALKLQMASEQWQSGIGIPYACRWIKKRRWEDEKLFDGASPGGMPTVRKASDYERLPEWT